STPLDSEILEFPGSRDYKTVGEIKNEFDYRVQQKKGQVLFGQGRYEAHVWYYINQCVTAPLQVVCRS
ncbi:MAG: hypothetical protein NTZ38_02965, partial [Candidatus Taylorbacteria bacterium]|nr:hypothetical protein [Candidatus Taylorbacteria bacterium]